MPDARYPKHQFVTEQVFDMKVFDKLGLKTFEFHPEVRRELDTTPRSSIVEDGKKVVIAVCPRVYWKKQVNYVAKFLVRSARDKIILLYVTGPKGKDESMSEVLQGAKVMALAKTRLSEDRVLVETVPAGKHSVHTTIANFCKEHHASILVLGSKKPEHHTGLFHFRRREQVEEHCRHALITTRIVHVAAPAQAVEA